MASHAPTREGSKRIPLLTRVGIAMGAALLCATCPSISSAQVDSAPEYVPAVSRVPAEIAYSDFLAQVNQNNVATVVISGDQIRGERKDGLRFVTVNPETNNSATIRAFVERGIKVSGEHAQDAVWPMQVLLSLLPTLLLMALCLYLWWRSQQSAAAEQGEGSANAMSFSKCPARRLSANESKVTFGDVAGIEEAKQEVTEIVEFLRDAERFSRLGGKIPRGVLLFGSPGTGKTLLARAIAGEAGVPFYAASGSDFVEMYVGVGARRVRDLFDQAEQDAPCIVFIDEIDAVGRHRGAGGGGDPGEREQTLNQLLVRMDGIAGNKGVIVVAATNRPDVLDPALLRPGRFDRQVVVPLPDVRGREQIIRVHLRGMPLADDVDPVTMARASPGFSGADLGNLVNEGALFAARAGREHVMQADFDQARDKILMGAERRSLVMSHAEKEVTAYHEAGHAIVGLHVPDHDPLYKVSIVPRGRALGLTFYLPEADRCSETRRSLNSRICALLGGRVAEELIFGAERVTTGAANDLKRATEIARDMVVRYGMSEKLGPLSYGDADDGASAGRSAPLLTGISTDTARAIDQEVYAIVERNYARAKSILMVHRDMLERMAGVLLEAETIDREQINAIVDSARVRSITT